MSKNFRSRGFLSNQKGQLFLEKISAQFLAKKFGTPLYCYSETRLRENVQKIQNTLQKHVPHSQLFYAVKSNNSLTILSILRSLGLGADAAGPFEIELAQKAKFPINKILYSGVFHSDPELQIALQKKVSINLDSLSAAKKLLSLGLPPLFSMRINPGIGQGKYSGLVTAGPNAKFGESVEHVIEAYQIAKKSGVKKFGLHAMTGSCVLNPAYFAMIAEKLLGIAKIIATKVKIQFEFIDLGGGLGIPYENKEKSLDLDQTFRGIASVWHEFLHQEKIGQPKLMLEPGRAIVGDTGVILTHVHRIKKPFAKKFIGVDAGMQTLLRPMLYGAWHEILLANDLNRKGKEKVSIVGPICENTDQIARDRVLPKMQENDLLAICDAGAYGFGMASQYNTRARPAEVLIKDNQAELIRPRETIAEIIGKQKVPSRLS